MRKVAKTLLILLFAALMAGCSNEGETLRERLMERRRQRLEKRGDIVVQEDYEEVITGQDFTKPLARTEAIYRYQKVTGDTEASWLIHRLHVPYQFESGWVFSGRYEIPFVYSDVPSRDNPNGDYEFGFSDINTQFLFIKPTTTRWSYVSGLQLVWPTASQDQMGRGKYLLGPTVGVAYHPESWQSGGFVGLLVSDIFDYAGKDDRADVHELAVGPILNYNFEVGDSFWFLTLASESRVNWEQDNDLFIPLKVSIGRLFFEGMIVTAGISIPVVNDYDLYDCQLELGVSFYF
jgi:hypothetical protein